MASQNMEITTRGASNEETPGETAQCNKLRFIVADDAVRHLVFINDRAWINHSECIPDNTKLVGGGRIERNGGSLNVYWGSKSCREEYHYDRPADTTEAEQVLAEVREAFLDWVKKFNQ